MGSNWAIPLNERGILASPPAFSRIDSAALSVRMRQATSLARDDGKPGWLSNAERFRGSRSSRIYAPTGALPSGRFGRAPLEVRRVPYGI